MLPICQDHVTPSRCLPSSDGLSKLGFAPITLRRALRFVRRSSSWLLKGCPISVWRERQARAKPPLSFGADVSCRVVPRLLLRLPPVEGDGRLTGLIV